MRIECDDCGDVKDSKFITQVNDGENSFEEVYHRFLCKQCYKEYLKKREDEDEDEE